MRENPPTDAADHHDGGDESATPEPAPAKKPRTRTSFSLRQLQGLERAFYHNHSPDLRGREEIGKSLGLSERTVRYWFQNRRQKIREIYKGTTEAAAAAAAPGGAAGGSGSSDRTPASDVSISPPLPLRTPQPPRFPGSHTPAGAPGPVPVAHMHPHRGGGGGAPHYPAGAHHHSPPYPFPSGPYHHPYRRRSYHPRVAGHAHPCCPCMDETAELVERLGAAVPGVYAHSSAREVLHSALNYIYSIQATVSPGSRAYSSASPDSNPGAASWASSDTESVAAPPRSGSRQWSALASAVNQKWVAEQQHTGPPAPEPAPKTGGQ